MYIYLYKYKIRAKLISHIYTTHFGTKNEQNLLERKREKKKTEWKERIHTPFVLTPPLNHPLITHIYTPAPRNDN